VSDKPEWLELLMLLLEEARVVVHLDLAFADTLVCVYWQLARLLHVRITGNLLIRILRL